MRLDNYLVDHNLAPDLKTARGLVMAGRVLVDDTPVEKPGFAVRPASNVRVKGLKQWVARSAAKLDQFIENHSISLKNRVVLDIGASTGGFTQVALLRGAKKVYALDVAYGIIDQSIRDDQRVVLFERTNLKSIEASMFDPVPDFIVADVSFISVRTVVETICNAFTTFQCALLFKPQFETAAENLEGGILRDAQVEEAEVSRFKEYLHSKGIGQVVIEKASVKGAKGNQEYIFSFTWNSVQ